MPPSRTLNTANPGAAAAFASFAHTLLFATPSTTRNADREMERRVGLDLLLGDSRNGLAPKLRGRGLEIAKAEVGQRVRRRERQRTRVVRERQLGALPAGAAGVAIEHAARSTSGVANGISSSRISESNRATSY